MFDQSFSLYTGNCGTGNRHLCFLPVMDPVFMKGGNTQARAQKYDEKKMEKVFRNLSDSYWNCHRS